MKSAKKKLQKAGAQILSRLFP
ncbi:MAG: hypothetical protein H6Q04_2039, partial [Acidobacteria bacterium]|nr:hypothetical protein [Acidobacteriota bacterium]